MPPPARRPNPILAKDVGGLAQLAGGGRQLGGVLAHLLGGGEQCLGTGAEWMSCEMARPPAGGAPIGAAQAWR